MVLISEVNNLSLAGFEDACSRARVRAAELASLVGRRIGRGLGSNETSQEARADRDGQEDSTSAIWV